MTQFPFVKEISEPVSAAMLFSMHSTLDSTIPARHEWLRAAYERGQIDAEGHITYPPAPAEYEKLCVFQGLSDLLPDFKNGSFRQAGAPMSDQEAVSNFKVILRDPRATAP